MVASVENDNYEKIVNFCRIFFQILFKWCEQAAGLGLITETLIHKVDFYIKSEESRR